MKKTPLWKVLLAIEIFFCFLMCPSYGRSATLISLTWDANTDPDLAGYYLYYKTGSPGPPYTTKIDVGNSTIYTLSLTDGGSYFFVVTAYDLSTLESDYSNEVSTDIETPTIIELSQFSAIPQDDQIIITWNTLTEIDNAAFNIWRSEAENGEYIKINYSLLESSGGYTFGSEYSYIDNSVECGVTYYYKLEDIDINGFSTFWGPTAALLPIEERDMNYSISRVEGIEVYPQMEWTKPWCPFNNKDGDYWWWLYLPRMNQKNYWWQIWADPDLWYLYNNDDCYYWWYWRYWWYWWSYN